MSLKKIWFVVLACLAWSMLPAVGHAQAPQPPEVAARAYLLVDVSAAEVRAAWVTAMKAHASQSRTRDYVEFPSQLLEHWLPTPEILDRYALHVETGRPIPAELVERIARAEHAEKVRQGAKEQQADDGSRLGNRVLAELIGGLVGGALIGWVLDRLFDTSPWLLLVFLGLGIVAAFRNIIRLTTVKRPDQ